MHQILSLRPYFDKKRGVWDVTDSRHFKENWRFASLLDFLVHPNISFIPEAERWNLFYTVAVCAEEKRTFLRQDVLIFDIDKLDHPERNADTFRSYLAVLAEVVTCRPEHLSVVSSGNGLHFIIGLKTPITESLYFERERRHYKALCDKIDHALVRANLSGSSDPSVFDPRRIMRLPGTENRKDGKKPRPCVVLQSSSERVSLDITELSGLPTVQAADQISREAHKKFPAADAEAVLTGCQFLKWCRDEPQKVSEQQWYAMLSIVPRLGEKGRSYAHELSKGHPSYAFDETETKIDQAMAASGPRTCANLQAIAGKCRGCKHFEKLTSPILITGENFIKTEKNGFHDIVLDKLGNPRPGKPNYDDLRKFFNRQHPYVAFGASGCVLIFEKTHWVEIPDLELQSFAQTHFNPKATSAMTTEFRNLLMRTQIRGSAWFKDSIKKKINFRNGVLDIETLMLQPHSPEYGFRYVLSYDYDAAATSPVFDRFMLDIMNDRQDLVDMLLQYTGYCFSGDSCWLQKALILNGVGANGKSTFMDVLKALAGEANYASVNMGEMQDPVHRYALVGKLFNLSEETPSRAMVESATFKSMVSGGEVAVKQLYKQPITIMSTTKLMFACNELPKTADATKGYLRRLLIAPFDRVFEDQSADPFMKDRILSELPGIFNRIIAAYRTLTQARGIHMPQAVVDEIAQYKLDIDTVSRWTTEQVNILPLAAVPSDAAGISFSALYNQYRIYCEGQGERPETAPTFARRFTRNLIDGDARRVRGAGRGASRERHYRGIQLLAEGRGF